MAITVGVEDIDKAKRMFGTTDFYLECHTDVIYFCWVANRSTVEGYIKEYFECLDIQVDDQWIDVYGFFESTNNRYELPKGKFFYSCRYILETN